MGARASRPLLEARETANAAGGTPNAAKLSSSFDPNLNLNPNRNRNPFSTSGLRSRLGLRLELGLGLGLAIGNILKIHDYDYESTTSAELPCAHW